MYFSLYLHFPFCKRKCLYCDFCSAAASEDDMRAYCDALCREIALTAPMFAGSTADTVFLGGGTPSIVPPDAMRKVLAALRERFAIAPNAEFTSEANPGTLTDAWLDALCDAGLNRLSIGLQAKQPRLLTMLGRIHDHQQALDALATAKRHGIRNLNADAMFGLPTQTLAEYLDTLAGICDAGVTHVSAYSLILEDGTPLKRQVISGELPAPDDDLAADMLQAGARFLKERGVHRYEISNYAKDGFACRHNLGYWQGKIYLGLGVSAASMLPSAEPDVFWTRRANTASLPDYLRAVSEGRLPIVDEHPVRRNEAIFETLMLGLRTTQGVDAAAFAARFGASLASLYGDTIRRLQDEGLALPRDDRLALTERGLALQNTVLMRFLPERLARTFAND